MTENVNSQGKYKYQIVNIHNLITFLRCSHCDDVTCIYLRVSLDVSLVKRLAVALLRPWGSGLASWWDKVGEVGGAEYTGGPRSLSCPPWNVLRMVEPRVRRHLSEEDEEEDAPAPEMLSVEGDAAGMRWPRELRGGKTRWCKLTQTFGCYNIMFSLFGIFWF